MAALQIVVLIAHKSQFFSMCLRFYDCIKGGRFSRPISKLYIINFTRRFPTKLHALIKWTANDPIPAVVAKVTKEMMRVFSSRPLPPGSRWSRSSDFTNV
jgi:hypothetical protein